MKTTTNKSTKDTNTKKDTKEEANNESNYGYKATKETGKESESNIMNSDKLTGYKLIEAAAKALSRKHKSVSKDTWRKEAASLYEHNEGFDGEPVSLSWFMTRLETLAASKYGKKSDARVGEGDSDLQSYLQLKKRGSS